VLLSGRFENILHVGLPSLDERHAILQLQQKKMPWHVDIDIAHLAKATDGANAASIVALCQAAAIQAMQRIDATADSQVLVRFVWYLISATTLIFGHPSFS
jgi:ATP-dependent 26S proteasome regulatory subunit